MAIDTILNNLPAAPGVYIMKGKDGEVLYIGKAKSLRSRVRSYFLKSGDGRYSVKFLASKVEDIGWVVTANEKEALFLEDTLLKQHKPRYNIRLKDSKTYVSIKITVNEKFPRIIVTRQIKKDGARYFGPYVSARAVRDTIKFLRRIFPLCVCSASAFRNRVRPCLDFQMGYCSAPAAGRISEEAYRQLVDNAMLFLEGKNAVLKKILKEQMAEAAQNLDFEKAAKIRDQIAAIEGMLEEQKVVTHRAIDRDVFAIARAGNTIAVQALLIRSGRLVNSADYLFAETGLPQDEILSSFITQFYSGGKYIPDEIIIPVKLEDAGTINDWLTEKKGKRIELQKPFRGDKLKLVKMAESNANEAIRRKTAAPAEKKQEGLKAVEELQRRLKLKKLPRVIEGFDISNISGQQAVGAKVLFRDGEPDKSGYRLYKVRTKDTPDDYAMMYEVLSRRFFGKKEDEMPGLVLLDGGKGQLGIAEKVFMELGVRNVELASLAKERPETQERFKGRLAAKGERVYLVNLKDPILLREGTKGDLLLRRVRDEVHRFAVSFHRKLRSKEIGSILDTVPGIGRARRNALLEKFGDIEAIARADINKLTAVAGITKDLAEKILDILRERLAS